MDDNRTRSQRNREPKPRLGEVMWSTRFGLLSAPAADRLLTLLVVLLLIGSRWAAFPASIWDQDEAHLAAGVLDFDPVHNRPHPPFFPGWIGLGKLVLAVAPQLSPATALQLLSAAFSVWMVFPLSALWSLLLPRRQAVAAALLFLMLPLPWLLAGRAYSGTAASALLVAAAACWLRPGLDRAALVLGSAFLAAAVLVRPHLLPVAAGLLVWRSATVRTWSVRLLPWVVPAVAGLAAVMLTARQAGGMAALVAVVRLHAGLHLGQLQGFSWSMRELGLVQALGNGVAGWLWLGAAVAGALILGADQRSRTTCSVLVWLLVVPLVVLLIAAHNPTLIRYSVPYLALTSGLVVAAAARLFERLRLPSEALLVAVVPLGVITAPHLGVYRGQPSPAARALASVEAGGRSRPCHLVAEASLAPFIGLRRLEGKLAAAVHLLPDVSGDGVASPVGTRLVAILETHDIGERAGRPGVLSTPDPLLRRLASPRLLDLLLIEGAADTTLSLEHEPGAMVLALPAGTSRSDIVVAQEGSTVEAGPFDLGSAVGGELVVQAIGCDELHVLAAAAGSPWVGHSLLGADEAVIDVGRWPVLGDLCGLNEVFFRFEATVADLDAVLRAELVVEEGGGECRRVGVVGE